MNAIFFFSSRRRHTRSLRDWSSDVCSSDLGGGSNRSGGNVAWRRRASGGRTAEAQDRQTARGGSAAPNGEGGSAAGKGEAQSCPAGAVLPFRAQDLGKSG